MEEVKRKLASIRRISEIRPIEGADNIEIAIVDGWQCVVKKGDFMEGQLCVYFEIDSFLPIRKEFEFLRKSSYKKMGDKEGFRLKTIKLKGQISQGLVLRIDSCPIPKDFVRPYGPDFFENHNDVTEILEVEKYEPPAPKVNCASLNAISRKSFPSFIRKTDLDRVQNIWDHIKDCKETFEVTTKLDGTSCTFYFKDGKFGVCSRNLELDDEDSFRIRALKIGGFILRLLRAIFSFKWNRIGAILSKFKLNCKNNVYWEMAKKYDVESVLRDIGENIALQGEIIGEGIQGNPECIEGHQFFIFDVWDIDKQVYLSPCERRYFLYGKGFRLLNHVIIDGYKDTICQYKTIDELIAYADTDSVNLIKDNKEREGLVFKSNESDLRFKVISNKYLLKRG